MTLSRLLSAVVLTVAFSAASQAAEIGMREIFVAAPERGRDLQVFVWYPAEAGGEAVLLGDNKVFKGVPALKNAPLVKGRFPLVVLSHGSGGRVQGMAWLATELARAGFIVAGPNHPGTTSGDSTPVNTPKVWERTQDLSAVIDTMTTDPTWSSAVDSGKIGVLGFSLGGAAAMEIAGARASLDAYAQYCDEYKKWDCAWYAGGIGYLNDVVVHVDKLDLRTIDKTRFDQSNLDPRVKSAVLIDPGLALAYDAESLKAVTIPMDFINLGSADTIPDGVIADKLAALTPRGTYATVKGAIHFSFLQECKPGGAELLKESGEVDPICADGGSRSRADLHAELVGLIRSDLQRAFKDPM
ncbi:MULTISPECIES: alpha/beta hydrolase [unclassified Mesorhizobium]|uniref:alpha/beta hydrolase family protein n=1 Tax=unclassified Mesorhizobium TaxID=325217 RepID=UPI000BAFE177|nr:MULTISPECIES: alpha/beta hydrolase [unclassified Mesorhizobium]TGT60892.1 dienelactone hydrolase [Mesorhizobium sp. M00.F.Ca.ET.170.01.1.1]AZO10092.1 dienelactone hydrolase [Mesorhizobium sp. M3A.F.Ca.ET.080.04.2.1]PBB86549.1 dienelactone hydrolase [Mesorhizobium sp. WSM3876]RWB75778.1 MAG: dienelactone hydrolase [Mesorhizobium sp.]RWB91530.1 MAG: dienelactone hydrolase [Mesorhizobium sp.]